MTISSAYESVTFKIPFTSANSYTYNTGLLSVKGEITCCMCFINEKTATSMYLRTQGYNSGNRYVDLVVEGY